MPTHLLKRRKKKLIQIKGKDLSTFRNRWHYKQNTICPILKVKVPFDKIALDHKHKRKRDPVGPGGDGLIRGVLQIQANALEGKIINNFKRLGLAKYIKLPDLLRNLADYLENPPIPQKYIHPSEEKKPPKLKKTSYNKVAKEFHKKYPSRKSLEYPKSKKLTQPLKKLFKEFNIKPEYLKE